MRFRDLFSRGRRRDGPGVPAQGRVLKLLPVIDREYCTGCRACVEACPNGCIGMVWDFATLLHPEDCESDGGCVGACPEGLIRMEWVVSTGKQHAGKWREAPAPRAE